MNAAFAGCSSAESGRRALRAALLLCALFLAGCTGRYFENAGEVPAAPRFTLASLPHKELWTGIVFNGNKVGFAHVRVQPLGEGLFRLESDTSIRLRVLGFDKSIVLRSSDVVREDLSLVSFDYDHEIDGNRQKLSGEARSGTLVVRTIAGASKNVQRLDYEGRLFPNAALTFYPLLAGLVIGSEHTVSVFNGELQAISDAEIRVEGWEKSTLFEGSAYKVVTRMLGLTSTAWIDLEGRPLLELGLNGVIVSALEDERTARSYLAAAALNQDDALVSWSLVKLDAPLLEARRLTHLSVALSTPGRGRPLSDARQQCRRSTNEWLCDIDATAETASSSTPGKYLQASTTVPWKLAQVTRLADELSPGSAKPEARIEAILKWMSVNIRKEAADVFTALDVLETRRAECQGHAYLYTALARASGIPTRVVSGLMYSEDHGGFLYHAWAESLVDGRWRAVDPTFGQARADATHIALVEGEAPADVVPLTEWVGHTRIRVLAASP